MDSSGLEYKKTEDGYAVTGIGTCKDTDIVIPSEHNGEPVTENGKDAFAQHMRLTSVVIPGSVKVIASGLRAPFSGRAGIRRRQGRTI